MRKLLWLLAVVAISAKAGQTGDRTVDRLACFGNGPTCFAVLSGGNFGPSGCYSNQIRWSGDTIAGKQLLALLMLAKSMGNHVNVSYSDSTCYAGGNYPSINWVNVLEN